jgi:hypothetical protein
MTTELSAAANEITEVPLSLEEMIGTWFLAKIKQENGFTTEQFDLFKDLMKPIFKKALGIDT